MRRQLERIFASADFDASRRSREFLRFIVEETLGGRGEFLSQSSIATTVFERRADFDPLVDPIVRIQAGRLRRSLERYYLLSGKQDTMRIELPKGAYVPSFRTTVADEREGAVQADAASTQAFATAWPSINVRAFAVANVTHEVADLALRFDEWLARELSRHGDLRVGRQGEQGNVATPHGPERFALSGTIRGAEGGLEVAAQLRDAASGEQLWTDAYYTTLKPGRRSGSLQDVARVIAARVGSEEGVVALRLATEHRQGKSVGPPSYTAILRSYEFYLVQDPASWPSVLDALRRAVKDDPECSLAWARLARLYLANHSLEIASLDTPLRDALSCAQTGVRLDPSSRRARCILAAVWLVKGELAAAREEAEKALSLAPDSLVYLEFVGWLLALVGDWERGAALAREAVERNPDHLPHVHHAIWANHLRRGEFTAAHEAALSYRDTGFFWRPLMRACCLGHLGRVQEAQSDLAELLRHKPDFASRGRTLIGHYIKFADLRERIVEGLRLAGLPLLP